ncbi:hypothetical protein KR084_009914 [Drosophila pseudotakahashii]|nr:hypothetical protein KR084_009914 [Drosophila pseudotakahashii]
MPPFSACSVCKGRTRKMVKDPRTLKQIYVCPVGNFLTSFHYVCKFKAIFSQKCFKSQVHKEQHPIEADNFKKSEHAKVIMNENQKTPENYKSFPGIDKSPCHTGTGYRKNPDKKEEKLKDPQKVISVPKVKPPLMQIVFIKNRKYVAISETADDE